ncbi:type VII secretion protein EccCb [Saccharopolyspora elongata]|uniref:Type VII secretion protein EccCb n=2 Tax=Saccharopolyspora elongata TaxID=2530387 RepID=A0A4R4Y0K4_9PSEU|nr:type VII secretion protein EccCb [Saccharopolyspora elongata]
MPPPPPPAPRPVAPPPPNAEATQVLRTPAKTEEPINLFDLVGFGDPAQAKLDQAWQPRGSEERYRIAIGVDDHGRPVHLDFKETGSAVGIFGSAGSGKSELLRTILFGLAATHSSASVNFACISREHNDQVWRSLYPIPHTALAEPMRSNDLTGRRFDEALTGLLAWQVEQFNRLDVGNFADYQRLQAESDAEPMPMLLVTVDDLPGVLRDRPGFAATIDRLVRHRRSGIKLVYTATSVEQIPQLAGATSVEQIPQLAGATSTRIVLRTSESDSVRLIGRAHDLPDAPGNGLLARPSQEPIRFRAAYTDLPHGTPRGDYFQTIPQIFAERIRGQGPPARQLILPPPGEPPAGIDLPLKATEDRGLNAKPETPLSVPIGVLDNPFHHRHEPLLLDLAGSDGNVAIVGRPRSGKSTAVRTTLLTLALTHTPAEVRFHCLDFGGGGLASLRDLPHTRVVTASHDSDFVALAVEELETLLTWREESFARHGIASVDEFRRRRREEQLGEVATDHFLVVDGWPEVHQHPGLVDRILRLARRGLSYATHVVVTANRWDDLPRELRDLAGGRIELRLADPRDSLISAEHADSVPPDKPGSGLHSGLRCAINVPVLGDELPTYADEPLPEDLDAKTRELVKRIDDSWFGARPPQLRRPPAIVACDELPSAEPGTIPLGLDGSDRPVHCSVANSAEHHLLIMGGEKSGRSTAVRTVLRGISKAYTKEQAMVLCIDFRRENHLTDLDDLLLAYIRAPKEAESALRDTVAALHKRLPGPNTGKPDWSGPEVFVVIDDYDLFGGELAKLCGMSEVLPWAAEIGLHLVLACEGHRYNNSDTIIPFVSNSATKLVLKDARCPAGLKGERGQQPRTPGEAVLTGRIDQEYQQIALRVAWIPHPLET